MLNLSDYLAGTNERYSDKRFAQIVRANPVWASSNWKNNYDKTPQIYPDDNPRLTAQEKELLKTDHGPYSAYWHPVVSRLCLDKIDWSKLF